MHVMEENPTQVGYCKFCKRQSKVDRCSLGYVWFRRESIEVKSISSFFTGPPIQINLSSLQMIKFAVAT